MRFQWVKVLMTKGKPYFVKIKSPTFVQSIPWVAECLEEHGIKSNNIDKYLVVTGPGRTPTERKFYYERPVGLIICESCGKKIPEDTNICIYCGNLLNERLIGLNKGGN